MGPRHVSHLLIAKHSHSQPFPCGPSNMTPLHVGASSSRPHQQPIASDDHSGEESSIPTTLSSNALSSSDMIRSLDPLNPGWDVLPNRHPCELENVTIDTSDCREQHIPHNYRRRFPTCASISPTRVNLQCTIACTSKTA